ncbi:hypothetical protein [Psychrobacillus sp. OK032]|nr:hypothetical protein [Psychrobacillus sp. OK032]SER70093.1 hypothetical protein SAMN05518872_101678 [Psychrobacillus sp. OK032]
MKKPVKIKWASPTKPIKFPSQSKLSERDKELLKKSKEYKGKFG